MKINMTPPKGEIPYSQSKEAIKKAKKHAKKFAEKNKEIIKLHKRIAKSQQPWLETIKKLKLSQLKSPECPELFSIKGISRNRVVEALEYGIERQEKQNKEANNIAWYGIAIIIIIGGFSLIFSVLNIFLTIILARG